MKEFRSVVEKLEKEYEEEEEEEEEYDDVVY